MLRTVLDVSNENTFLVQDYRKYQYLFSFLTHPQDLLLAVATGGSEELLVATFAVHLALLLHKPSHCQRGVAVSTVEFLRVP